GHRTLEASADGYFPVRRELVLPGGGAASIELYLESRQTSGVLAATSPVTGAELRVDGKPAGTVPVETVLPAGVHKVALSHAGYVPLETTLVIEAGGRKDLSLPLEREAPITSKWWFWTAGGAVVIAVTTLTVALVGTRSPEKGTIPP